MVQYSHERTVEAMEANGCDAIMASSTSSIYYFSNVHFETLESTDRFAAVILPKAPERARIICIELKEGRTKHSWIDDVDTYTEFRDDPVEVLADVLSEMGLDTGSVAIEEHDLSAHLFEGMKGKLPSMEIIPGSDIITSLQQIKTEEEIEIIERGTKVTEKAIAAGVNECSIGDPIGDVGKNIVIETAKRGGDMVRYEPLVLPSRPNAERIRDGDLLYIDYGAGFELFESDLGRVVLVGDVDRVDETICQDVRRIELDLIDMVKPGVSAAELYEACRESLGASGYNLRAPHIGHSLGYSAHEEPIVQPYNSRKIREDMILNLEPGLAPGVHRIEDTLRVTADGAEILSDSIDNDGIIRI